MKNLSQDIRCSWRNLNPVLSEYEAVFLPTRLRRSAMKMETVRSIETLVTTYESELCQISKDYIILISSQWKPHILSRYVAFSSVGRQIRFQTLAKYTSIDRQDK
jgi:hypothetical protein